MSEEIDPKNELAEIKRLYTMASEHKIHDAILESEGDVDLFTDVSEGNNEDENLELF